MLLAFGVWLVNQEAICPEDLNLSGNLLGKFVMLFDALYGKLIHRYCDSCLLIRIQLCFPSRYNIKTFLSNWQS